MRYQYMPLWEDKRDGIGLWAHVSCSPRVYLSYSRVHHSLLQWTKIRFLLTLRAGRDVFVCASYTPDCDNVKLEKVNSHCLNASNRFAHYKVRKRVPRVEVKDPLALTLLV